MQTLQRVLSSRRSEKLTRNALRKTNSGFERMYRTILAAVFFACLVSRSIASDPPNVIVIMVDDLGYADLGCQGSKDIRTPHIDSLAASGIRFTAGYVPTSVCGPSRASFITGQYSVEFGINGNGASTHGVPLDQPNLAEYLKNGDQPFYSAAIGKWHLGESQEQRPTSRGFDYFFGFLGGASEYFPFKANSRTRSEIVRNEQTLTSADYPAETYLTDLFTDEAVAVILDKKRRGDKRLFLYLAYNAPHGPLQASEAYIERNKHIQDKKRRSFAAMMTAVDDGVGRILKSLEENAMRDNTLIVFLSDNGGPTRVNTSLNTPFRGFKGDTWEGGVRVPFMLSWPATLPAGETRNEMFLSIDIVPTILKLTGRKIPPAIDGIDLLPWLIGNQAELPKRDFYFWRGSSRGVRIGDHKYTKNRVAGVEFFDIAANPGEDPRHQLSDAKVRSLLEEKAKEWESTWPPTIGSDEE